VGVRVNDPIRLSERIVVRVNAPHPYWERAGERVRLKEVVPPQTSGDTIFKTSSRAHPEGPPPWKTGISGAAYRL